MNVALIPARGGSKSIPLKNIKEINEKPLLYWSVKAANECKYIDVVYVATENSEIKKVVENFKFKKTIVINRSLENASDTAPTESVMLEFANKYNFENIVLIQATSPLLTGVDLERGFQKFNEENVDSVISVVEQKRFIWKKRNDGTVEPQNYDIFSRPRRQDFEGLFVENGAFYITSKKQLLLSKNRISGRIAAVTMHENTFWEIDEMNDFNIVEMIMKNNKKEGLNKKNKIKLFITDCDGCLTDGGMYLLESGDEIKKFNAQDGKGFEILREKGVKTGIVTREKANLILNRAQKLKVDYLRMGVVDKKSIILEICTELGIKIENVAYVGDDINDLDVMSAVGYCCSVNNAIDSIKKISNYVSPYYGGNGAVRDCIEHLCSEHLI